MSVRKSNQRSSSKSKNIQKPIHTRYDQLGGYSDTSQTRQVLPARKETFLSRLTAQSERDRPIRESVINEIEQLRDNQQIEKHWRKRVKAGSQAKAEYETKKARGLEVRIEDDPFPSKIALYDPIKHLSAFYIHLAVFHDRMRHGSNCMVNEDLLAICPEIIQLSCPGWIHEKCLKYVKLDLENKDLFSEPLKPAGRRQLKKRKKTPLQEPEDDSTHSPTQLAEMFDLPLDPLRKRLQRCRKRNHSCFIEITDRTSKQPQFIYYYGQIKHIINSLKASSETSSKRPAKKKSH